MYQALWNSRGKLFRSWILVPSGILVILVACFGVDTLFKHFGVSFPASVACMLLLFAGLWISELVIGSHRTRQVVAAIDVSVSCWISHCGLLKASHELMRNTGGMVVAVDQLVLHPDVCCLAAESVHHCG